VSERTARLVLAVLVAAMVVGVCLVRLPGFWGDGATYYTMAHSLAEDGDLRYEARDVFRVRREFPSGPQGLFLKRASGGLRGDGAGGFPWVRRVTDDDKRIYFAKAFTYPVAAAPLVALMGTRGLLVTNALALGFTLVLAYLELRTRASPAWSLAAALSLVLATVAPLYLVWPTPELFTLALVAAGLFAWRRGQPMWAAVLLGIATYTKPYNLFLALPLGVEPFLRAGRSSWWPALRESLRRGLAMVAVVAGLFAVNAAITGELNYQGGERKTFYGRFPEEAAADGQRVTFGNSGFWMTTDQLGPAVEGEDAASARTGPPRPPRELAVSFLRNLYYFWVGRFGGALAYFLPAMVALAVFLARGPRSVTGWLAFAALVVSWLFYIRQIPDNWYGGGGTVGNRYFLNLLPLFVLMLPARREPWAVGGGVLSALVLAPMWLHPLHHSLRPGDHATRGVFPHLPPELTMLNDLSVFTDAWRKKVPYGDTEGDAHKHWPADPKRIPYCWATGRRQERRGVEGFWLGPRAGSLAVRRSSRCGNRCAGWSMGDRVIIHLRGPRTGS
jgi:hypothetical protein